MAAFKEWPNTVPYKPLTGTMSIEVVDDAARSDFDPPGEPLVRGRSTRALSHVSFTIIPITDEENEYRKDFVKNDLRGGVRRFRMRLYQSGFIGYECQLVQPMVVSDHAEMSPVLWDVQISLLVWDFTLERSEADIFVAHEWVPGTSTEEQFLAIIAPLHEFLYRTYPEICRGTGT